MVTRAEFPTVALGRRFASSEAAPLLPVLTEFRRADSSETLLTLLANHPELLGDAAQALLQEIIDQHWLRRSEGPASDYEDDLSLLISCREVGTARTLSELDRSVSADLAGLHALADAATERDEQTPSVETRGTTRSATRHPEPRRSLPRRPPAFAGVFIWTRVHPSQMLTSAIPTASTRLATLSPRWTKHWTLFQCSRDVSDASFSTRWALAHVAVRGA